MKTEMAEHIKVNDLSLLLVSHGPSKGANMWRLKVKQRRQGWEIPELCFKGTLEIRNSRGTNVMTLYLAEEETQAKCKNKTEQATKELFEHLYTQINSSIDRQLWREQPEKH